MVLYFILGLPLFVLITNAMFDSRQKNVYQVTFLAESIDFKTSKSSLPVMQFDDSVAALSGKGLCSRETSVSQDGVSPNDGGSNPTSVAKSPNNKVVKDASTPNAGSLASVNGGAAASPILAEKGFSIETTELVKNRNDDYHIN